MFEETGVNASPVVACGDAADSLVAVASAVAAPHDDPPLHGQECALAQDADVAQPRAPGAGGIINGLAQTKPMEQAFANSEMETSH